MPRVIRLAERYNETAGEQRVFVVQVSEKDIIDWELKANRNGHISCPHGGECLAGLAAARTSGLATSRETAVLDSTAHALKFAGFQEMYFTRTFPEEYEITYDETLINAPTLVRPADLEKVPAPGRPLAGEEFKKFVDRTAEEIAEALRLRKR
jgi:threonine synthase